MNNKVVLVGAPGVGKTSFFLCVTRQLRAGNCVLAYQPTIGATYGQLQSYVDNAGKIVHVSVDPLHVGIKGPMIDLWDTAGQERYSSLLPMYVRKAIVVVLMHENTKLSLQRATEEAHNARSVAPHAKIFVVQTKSDTGEPFNSKFVKDIDADGWAYVCTIGNDFSAVDDAILAIAKLTETVRVPDKDEVLKVLSNSNPTRSCCA